jgi:hypothetical protein
MGMDVVGKSAKNKRGEYFRANVWSWRVIHALLDIADELGPGVFAADTVAGMSNNDGHGLDNQEDCDALADAMDKLLDNPVLIFSCGLTVANDEISIPLTEKNRRMGVKPDGSFLGRDEEAPPEELHSPWSMSFEHVRKFIVFLRNCGGFAVH